MADSGPSTIRTANRRGAIDFSAAVTEDGGFMYARDGASVSDGTSISLLCKYPRGVLVSQWVQTFIVAV